MEPPHPRLLACPPCRPSGTMDPPLMALNATPWTRTLDVTSVSARGGLLRNATGACQHGPAAAQVRCNTHPFSSTSLTSQQHWTTAAGTSLSCCRSRQYQFETTSVFTSLPLAFFGESVLSLVHDNALPFLPNIAKISAAYRAEIAAPNSSILKLGFGVALSYLVVDMALDTASASVRHLFCAPSRRAEATVLPVTVIRNISFSVAHNVTASCHFC
jgi:hypothetical protein